MILDKIMEKKDLEIYILFRIKTLEKSKRPIMMDVKPDKREIALSKVSGRIKELEYLLKILRSDELKDKSKEFWRKVAQQEDN